MLSNYRVIKDRVISQPLRNVLKTLIVDLTEIKGKKIIVQKFSVHVEKFYRIFLGDQVNNILLGAHIFVKVRQFWRIALIYIEVGQS